MTKHSVVVPARGCPGSTSVYSYPRSTSAVPLLLLQHSWFGSLPELDGLPPTALRPLSPSLSLPLCRALPPPDAVTARNFRSRQLFSLSLSLSRLVHLRFLDPRENFHLSRFPPTCGWKGVNSLYVSGYQPRDNGDKPWSPAGSTSGPGPPSASCFSDADLRSATARGRNCQPLAPQLPLLRRCSRSGSGRSGRWGEGQARASRGPSAGQGRGRGAPGRGCRSACHRRQAACGDPGEPRLLLAGWARQWHVSLHSQDPPHYAVLQSLEDFPCHPSMVFNRRLSTTTARTLRAPCAPGGHTHGAYRQNCGRSHQALEISCHSRRKARRPGAPPRRILGAQQTVQECSI